MGKKRSGIPEVNEILLGLIRRPKIRHPPLINHAHFVKVLEKGLAGLVQRHDGRRSERVGGDAQRLDELEGGAGIEAAGGTGPRSALSSLFF